LTDSLLTLFLVVATKYTTNFRSGPKGTNVMANFTGNGTKSLVTSVNNSLKNLQTDYIDLVGCSQRECEYQILTV
jgi:aryl-alcohol dehydrogenase-like predicted oxidoreductase